MTSLRNVALALALVAGAGACKQNDTKHDVDKAADKVNDKTDDLRDERKDLADKKVDEVEKSKDVVKKAGEAGNANADFEAKRDIRVRTLRAQLAVIATQPKVISTLAANFPITDAGRSDVNEKLTKFQMRLDEASNLVQGLQTVDASTFKDRDDAINDAMDKLDDARKDAWKALKDAPKAENPSS